MVCFREAKDFLVIDPDECIDCGSCVDACPADAIYADNELPPELFPALEWNANLATTLPPVLNAGTPPLIETRGAMYRTSGPCCQAFLLRSR
jgi:ferredoxin